MSATIPPEDRKDSPPAAPETATPAPSGKGSRARRWLVRLAIVAGGLVALWLLLAYVVEPEYAYTPASRKALNEPELGAIEYDLLGERLSDEEARELEATDEGRERLNALGVRIDDRTLEVGREAFYDETFGNEVYLSDILGILDGPLTAAQVVKAVAALGGQGTTNLRVELADSITIGDRTLERGTLIDTGIDVPAGAYAPLGMKVKLEGGRIKTGIACAACHSTVDPQTMKVVHGAPNSDFNVGLLLALAPNTASYFVHANLPSLEPFQTDPKRTITTIAGRELVLPDPVALEKAVDAVLASWPPGNFDSMIDLEGNPTQIPTSFTRGGHPYGWSGFAALGPFHGVSVLNNNVHAMNSDALSHTTASEKLFGIDPELYLALTLQNAANPSYRYDLASGELPSAFFDRVDPTPGVPGVNHMAKLPTFPRGSLMSPDGLWISLPGHPLWKHVNAISAWQDRLVPPPPHEEVDSKVLEQGEEVFRRAGCADCHSGPALTNHRVLPVADVGTEPARARALKATEKIIAPPEIYPFDTPVPLPSDAEPIEVPSDHLDEREVELAFAWGDSGGGYKVMHLVGLYWSAPYLHDGGVSVGPDAQRDLGIPGTLLKFVAPDPANSLRALVDRQLRAKVVAANEQEPSLDPLNIRGTGHDFWVDDAAGFSRDEQQALIEYLLHYRTK